MVLDIKDAPEKAQRIFKQLVEVFDEQGINPTPLNYYIWYQYYKGNHPRFRQEMDAALNDPFGYNDRLGRRLYDEYFSDDEPTNEFDRAFKRLINLVIQKMNVWSDKLESHTETLSQCTDSLNSEDVDAERLRELTQSVLSTASSMKESSEAFQQDMLQSNEEISHLRQQLIEAKAETMTDELTEIGNRKAFNHSVRDAVEAHSDQPESLILILSDIDHFKRFNDTFGHLVGDSVLRYFANMMKKTRGENESLCRFGGEEFAILLTHSDLDAGMERAETIRETLQQARLKRKDSTKNLGEITASFGVAAFAGEEQESIEDWIHRADEALYQAKNSGRNKVVAAEPFQPATDG
ncbi:GGDEF domain-containing protein [Hydrogenovibrio halophilus]|uniref:GGDEF domain-containing protein n=1 Tax=Hydrogenovibrio halophilus TaxID=373391 RepID=UPI000362682B|nr:GGDEF domain-containing protein [Hydrogenovibrio halophilus]